MARFDTSCSRSAAGEELSQRPQSLIYTNAQRSDERRICAIEKREKKKGRTSFFGDYARLEVVEEEVGLLALQLPVLDSFIAQILVQLHGFDCGSALLVLARVLPEPEVDIVRETAAIRLGCFQDDVRVSVVERPVVGLLQRHGLEVLDPPDLESCCLPSSMKRFINNSSVRHYCQ